MPPPPRATPPILLMHKGGNKLNLNLDIGGLFLQETYTNTDTSRPSCTSMGVSSHMLQVNVGALNLA